MLRSDLCLLIPEKRGEMSMEGQKLRPARLNEDTLHILREAEAAINQRLGVETNPAEEVYLVALNRTAREEA